MSGDDRADLVVVAGGRTAAALDGIEQVIARIRAEVPNTAVVHHDLSEVGQGVVLRRLRLKETDHPLRPDHASAGARTRPGRPSMKPGVRKSS